MACVSLLALATAFGAQAAEEKPYADTVTGDWGGARSKLADQGIEVELGYDGDLMAVTSGGKKRIATYLDFIQLRANLDNEKLLGIKGNTVSVSVITSNGTTTNASTVGSTQGVNNSEVSANAVRLYEAWVQQNFMDDRISVLVGLHDLNTEFVSTPVSDNFLVPTFQIGQSIAQSGNNGPSVFPTTSLAGRVKVKPTEESYVAVAAYDGVPGRPNHTSGTAVHFGKKDGLLLIGEAGWTPKAEGTDDELNKLALGIWHYTGGFDDLTRLGADGNPKRTISEGVYGLASSQVYRDKDGRSAAAFVRGGFSEGDTAQVDYDIEAGVVANGFVPSRPEGQLGLGVSYAHNGDKYMKAQAAAATPSDRAETIYELYYRDTVVPGVTVQPDLIYVVNPGTDTVTDNAFIVGGRLSITF
jgi:porin